MVPPESWKPKPVTSPVNNTPETKFQSGYGDITGHDQIITGDAARQGAGIVNGYADRKIVSTRDDGRWIP